MNLKNKKVLASKVLKVGKNRIHFDSLKLTEIKEAITKQDIRDLNNERIITIKPVSGRKTIVKRKTRRGPGKIKKKVNKRKQIYVKITRKLRNYIKELKAHEKINQKLYKEIRKKIRMRAFKSKAHLREYLTNNEDVDFSIPIKKSKTKSQVTSINKTKTTQGETKK